MTETAPNRLQPKDDLELRRALDLLVPAPQVSARRNWDLVVAEAHGKKPNSSPRRSLPVRRRMRLALALAVLATAIALPALALAEGWSWPLGDVSSESADPSADPIAHPPYPPQLLDSGWEWTREIPEIVKDPFQASWVWIAPPDFPISEIASGSVDGVEWKIFVYPNKQDGGFGAVTYWSVDSAGSYSYPPPVFGTPPNEQGFPSGWFNDGIGMPLGECCSDSDFGAHADHWKHWLVGGEVAKEVDSISIRLPSGDEIEATIAPLPAELGIDASVWTAVVPISPRLRELSRHPVTPINPDADKVGQYNRAWDQAFKDNWKSFVYTARSADGTVLEQINGLGEVLEIQPPSTSVTGKKG